MYQQRMVTYLIIGVLIFLMCATHSTVTTQIDSSDA